MKIPSKLPITAEQSRAVRFQLGLTQANVIEQSELAGHKLKNFETGRFVPDMAFLQSLREFYESRGIEFNEAEAEHTSAVEQKTTHGIGIVAQVQTNRFLVDQTLSQEQVDSILDRMDGNDASIAELMDRALESGLLSIYSGKTDTDTRKLYELMAENYLLFRILQGRNILIPPSEKTEPKTQSDLIGGLFSTIELLSQQPVKNMAHEGKVT